MSDQPSVKTYKTFSHTDAPAHFSIARMEDIYEQHQGEPDAPHRHDYFTLLIVKEAKGQHIVDFNAFDLNPCQIYFIAPGQVHQMLETEKSTGYVMVFDFQFLLENHIPLHFIEDLNLFNAHDYSPPLVPATLSFEKIVDMSEEIFQISQSKPTFQLEAIGAWLKLLLIECHNSCSVKPSEMVINTHQNHLIKQFKNLITTNYAQWHSTSQYADELNITPDHLNKVVKMQTGLTAKEHIQARITLGAKRLLHFSDLSIKEIGFQLGFAEPANFSAFFKKCTGISPSKFKSSI